MRMLAVLLLALFVGSDADTPSRARERAASPKPIVRPGAVVRAVKCSIKCGGAATRQAVVSVTDDAFLMPSPNPICACTGDTIEWTYKNGSSTKDKQIQIRDVVSFLDNGDCKTLKTVMRTREEKGRCHVLMGLPSGTYKYELKGSHSLDPEVEVQGGISPSTPPRPQPSTPPSPVG